MSTEIPIGFPTDDQKRANLLNTRQDIPQNATQNGGNAPSRRFFAPCCCSCLTAFLRGIYSGLTMFLCCLAFKPRLDDTKYNFRASITGRVIGGIISFWILFYVFGVFGGGYGGLIIHYLSHHDDDYDEYDEYSDLLAAAWISRFLYVSIIVFVLIRMIGRRDRILAVHDPISGRLIEIGSIEVV
eukprot:g8903.t1